MQLSFGKKEAAKNKADDKSRKGAASSKSAREKDSKRSGVKADADTQKGKRKHVEVKEKKTEPTGMFSAPAEIMGPRLLFILAVVILCVLGLVMIYSSSSIEAYGDSTFGNDPMYFFRQQVVWLAIGTIACVIAALIPYQVWKNPRVAYILWGATALLLFAVIAGFGTTSLGADRSLRFGPLSLQPAEFAKITVVLVLASVFERWHDGQLEGVHALGELAVISGITLFLIYKQPDLGTSMILIIGILAMLILSGVDRRVILGIIGLGVLFFVFTTIAQPYHLDRIATMLNPWKDAQGDGYQTVQGFLAFGSGGLFGTGLGMSRQKYDYLPYAYNDFIYAVIGEELGFVGALFTLLLFALFVYAGMRISHKARDTYGAVISGALTTMVGFQAFVNMACVAGMAPVTGKALPFISYGGSSLLATMIMCGLILSVSRLSRLDNQVEKRRENLIVMDGGQAAARRAGQPQQGAPQSFGGIIGGIAGAVGGVSSLLRRDSALQQGRNPRSGANAARHQDAEHMREARRDGAQRGGAPAGSGRLSSERGRSNSGYGGRGNGGPARTQQGAAHRGAAPTAGAQRNVGYGSGPTADGRAGRTRQQAANIDAGHGTHRAASSRGNRAAYGNPSANDARRMQGQRVSSPRRSRRGDLDVDLVDIVPNAPRRPRPDAPRQQAPQQGQRPQAPRQGQRPQGPRPNRSSSASHGGGHNPRRPRR